MQRANRVYWKYRQYNPNGQPGSQQLQATTESAPQRENIVPTQQEEERGAEESEEEGQAFLEQYFAAIPRNPIRPRHMPEETQAVGFQFRGRAYSRGTEGRRGTTRGQGRGLLGQMIGYLE